MTSFRQRSGFFLHWHAQVRSALPQSLAAPAHAMGACAWEGRVYADMFIFVCVCVCLYACILYTYMPLSMQLHL